MLEQLALMSRAAIKEIRGATCCDVTYLLRKQEVALILPHAAHTVLADRKIKFSGKQGTPPNPYSSRKLTPTQKLVWRTPSS